MNATMTVGGATLAADLPPLKGGGSALSKSATSFPRKKRPLAPLSQNMTAEDEEEEDTHYG